MSVKTIDLTLTKFPSRATPQINLRLGNLSLYVGILILAVMALLALFAPQIAPYDIAKIDPRARLQAPGSEHFFGTDALGRDLFSRVVYGGRITMRVAFSAVLLGAVPGVLLGMFSGIRRGWPDALLTQCMDAWMALPAVLVALTLVTVAGRSVEAVMLALALATIPMFFRITRAETLRVYTEPFVDAAFAMGGTDIQVIVRHVLPHVTSTLIVVTTVSMGRMLLATSALSFIGLGAPPPSPEWGTLLAEGRNYFQQAWWLMWIPGAVLTITTFGLFLLGDGLRDRLDPHI